MATWQHLRSSTANKRPTTSLADGRIAINTNAASPGLFFKDSAGTGIVKVGPVHVGTTAPNSVPAPGGSTGNYLGEQWLDTGVSPAQMKVWNGSTWVGVVADELPVSKLQDGTARQLIQTDAAGTGVEWTSSIDLPGTLDVTGATTLDSTLSVAGNVSLSAAATLVFEGTTDDAWETTLSVVDPTSDRSILLPNVSGTVVTTGDSGTITSTMIADGTIVDADVSATAEIAVSKLADGAARQLLQTDAAGTGVEWTSNVDIPGTLDVTGTATFDGAVTVAGDLTVNGTTTTISTQNLLVEDKNIIIGDVATPTDGTADGGGITLKGATDKTINWVDATDAWTSSERFSVPLGSAASPSLTFTDDPNTGIYSPGADQVAISAGGSGRLFVDASGRVSVGENFTSAKFSIAGQGGFLTGAAAATNKGTVVIQDVGISGFTSDGGIEFKASSFGNGYGARILCLDGGELLFGNRANSSAWSERLRITSAGLVGVGTSSPSAVLYVNNASGIDPSLTYGATAGQTFKNGTTELAFGAATTAPFAHWMQARFSTNAAQPLLLNPLGGNVGIGTTSPSELFHVAGNARIGANDTSAAQLEVGAGATGNRNSYIDLIGDTTYTDYGFRLIRLGGANNNTVLRHRGTGEFASITEDAAPLTFYTSNSERLRITSAGLVGVGTSSPQAAIHAVSVTGLGIQTYTTLTGGAPATSGTTDPNVVARFQGGSVLFDIGGTTAGLQWIQPRLVTNFAANFGLAICPNGGNVGIGTTSPSQLLDVRGTNACARIGTTGVSAVRISNGTDNIYGIDTESTVLQFAVNQVERVRIDSSGRLLVGTSSVFQGGIFEVAGLAAVGAAGDNAFSTALILSKTRGATVNSQTIVQNNDELGSVIFRGSDGSAYKPGAFISAAVDGTPGLNDMPGRLVFSTTADGASSPTERMRISRDGAAFLVANVAYTSCTVSSTQSAGTTYALFAGKHSATNGASDSGTASVFIYTNGNVANTNNSYGAISDAKLKENIVDATSQWDDIKALQVRKYNFKEGQTHTQIGLVAQEVELVSPGLVTESPDRDEDGNDLGTVTKSVNYSVLYMKAVKALQEAMERIETLEAKVAVLEAKP